MAIGSPQWMYASGEAYELEQSLKFNDDDEAHLSFTPASAGNRKTWTWSAWVKLSEIGVRNILFSASTSTRHTIRFEADHLDIYRYSGGYTFRLKTTAVYRDTSAWYHIVVAQDTTQSTASNRLKLYVNGEQVTDFDTETYPSQDSEWQINDANLHTLGCQFNANDALDYYDGYQTEVNFIDGQALTPTSFGETGDYGEWKPIEYSGTYGTNGFYLPFKQDYTVEGFSTVTYKGTGANQYIGGTGFQPDFTWIKQRSSTQWHQLTDSVRGVGKQLFSNDTSAEDNATDKITAFNTDGFSLSTHEGVNGSGATYVAWNWDMGGSNATNTDGSITSTVRANTTYGQSIVSYTGTNANGATIGHGLSSTPEMLIVKARSAVGEPWQVYHSGIASDAETDNIQLNTTGAAADNANIWNDTAPTSSVFSVGVDGGVNANGTTYIAYCFHSVTGYSKFGSYSGTGSSGNTITTGFKPAFVMVKNATTSGENWYMFDSTREPFGELDTALKADESNAEATSTTKKVEFTSTGFKLNSTNRALNHSDGDTYIYMAFADTREYAYWLDQSGNNNDWTSNNLTESDISVDSPTNNFATLNPIAGGTNATISEGNLKKVGTSSSFSKAYCTIPITSGKWYMELCAVNVANNSIQVGVTSVNPIRSNSNQNGEESGTSFYGLYNSGRSGGYIFNDASATNSLTRANNNDIVGIAFDADAGNVKYYINNTLVGSSSGYSPTNVSGTFWFCLITRVDGSDAGSSVINFGQDSSFAGNKTAQGNQDGNNIGDFYYTPPTGFLALCTKNLPDVAVVPSEHFNTVLYTGTGSNQDITGVGFAPEFVWAKDRTLAHSHMLTDKVRGIYKTLNSDNTYSEGSLVTALRSFGADGFSIGSNANINNNNDNYVAWNWKANGSGSSNTNGTITSTVSANVDAGFSIVSYTGTGSAATVGHGLNQKPDLAIFKDRDATIAWIVEGEIIGSSNPDGLRLSSTEAKQSESGNYNNAGAAVFNFPNGWAGVNNSGSKYIAYCFHSVDGYSKIGTYETNGASGDNPGEYVYLGFRPAFVMIKSVDHTNAYTNWVMYDNKRNGYNRDNEYVFASTNEAEMSTYIIHFYSNGFQVYDNYHATNNSGTYMYIAFAETPFKYSNAR